MVIGHEVLICISGIIIQRNLRKSPGGPVKIRINRNWGVNRINGRDLPRMLLKVIVIPVPQTSFQITDKVSLRMLRVVAVEMVVLYCGGGFVLQFEGLNVEDRLFVGLE
jgi:hypothetical protein